MSIRKTAIAAALSAMCAGALAAPTPLATLDVGSNAGGIAFDPVLRYAFVTNYDDGTISEIDVDTLAVTATIPAGEKPRRVVADAASQRLYYVNDTSPGTVTVIDTTRNGILARIAVGDRPRNIAADFRKGEVYVTNRDSHTLSVIDVATHAVAATVPTGRFPGGIEIDTLRGRVYVPSASDGTVTVVDQGTHEPLQTIAVGRNPGAATVDERTGKVYVNNIDDRTITVLDAEGKRVATLASGAGSTFGAVSPIYHRYYLPNAGDNTLTLVDTDHDVVVGALPVGAAPQQAIVDHAAGRIYVANRGSHTVSVIDAATGRPAGTVATGANPWRLSSAMGRLFVLDDSPSAADSVTIAAEPQTPDDTSIVTEYVGGGARYFSTADPIENRLLADGLFGDEWNRTMGFWRVWKHDAPGRVAMCRLVRFDAQSVANAYAADAEECRTLKSTGSWHYEGASYYVALPDAFGRCSSGTVPLFRLSDGAGNERYTIDPAVRESMTRAGWGVQIGAFACVPELPLTYAAFRATRPMPPGRLPMVP